MAQHRLLWPAAALSTFVLSGCPITDDYYLLPEGAAAAAAAGGSGGTASLQTDAGEAGAKPIAGGDTTGHAGEVATGPEGGSSASAGGAPGQGDDAAAEGGVPSGAGGTEQCVPATERCNGHDDDCDGVIDEFACASNSCFGFVLPGDAGHGYMYCTGYRRANWGNARAACEEDDMRLAWLQSEPENAAVVAKLKSLGSDSEISMGATDQALEGDWRWFGGEAFWKGDENGAPVAGAFSAWTVGTPNDENNEDCAILLTASATWGDRSCNAVFAYLCEEPE